MMILFLSFPLTTKAEGDTDQPPENAPSNNQGSATPDNMTEEVKGQAVDQQIQIKKPAPEIQLDVKEIVESGTPQTETVLQETKPIPSVEDFAHYSVVNSNQVIRPWMPLIPQPPLVTFYPGLSKIAAKRWEFRVSDEGGEVVKSLKGKGVPPRHIEWNGVNERGHFITVGTLYSYQFITFDEHGNAHTFPGEPFQLDALMYQQKGKVYIEFANHRFFEDDKSTFRPLLKGLWERAIDVIRENSSRPITVEMYTDNTKSPLAEERRQVAVNSISDATNIPAIDIRHKVDKISDRGDILRLVMVPR